MTSVYNVTQVIPAKEDTIYDLEIKIVDKSDGKPVPGAKINISGTSSLQKKDFNLTLSSDNSGIISSTLDKGTFRLSFVPEGFPSNYNMPAPFFYDLKDSGKTMMTINLESDKYNNEQWGIAEVEVLDYDNKPVPDIEIQLDGRVPAPGNPDKISSVTNSEGIAVFKVDSGSYKAVFPETSFPAKYKLQSPINIEVSADTASRYTLRLASATSPSSQSPEPVNSN